MGWPRQEDLEWQSKEDKRVLFFCSTMGNSVGGASTVYTTLESPWYLELVSCVGPCTSIYGLCFGPFWLNEHFEMRRPSITWPGFSPASLNNSVSQVSNQWFSKNSRVHSTHIYWITCAKCSARHWEYSFKQEKHGFCSHGTYSLSGKTGSEQLIMPLFNYTWSKCWEGEAWALVRAYNQETSPDLERQRSLL